jgi:maltokinase
VTERPGETGYASTSYPSDERLLDELREQWPPPASARDAAGAARGYNALDLGDREPAAALRLGDRFAVALIDAPDGSFAVVSLSRDELVVTDWRPAVAGDGLSAFVAGVPAASERAIEADQTNASVIVGERAIVKWFRRIGPSPSRAAALIAHLGAVGFRGMPTPLGSLVWRRPGGPDLTIAQGDGFIPGARDGWDWCVERLERHVAHGRTACPVDCDPWIGAPLGRLVAELHAALAIPSAVIATPLMAATADTVTEWHDRARATLAEAIALTIADDPAAGALLERLEPAMRTAIDRLLVEGPVATQPVHGDLHVGQILESAGGLAVIDFDGNPALDAGANALRQPVERDLAQMVSSLDHVGRVVAERASASATAAASDAIGRWIVRTRRELLVAAGGTPDPVLLAAFEIEQECRELIYAARFLKRWRYAPMATLSARYGG